MHCNSCDRAPRWEQNPVLMARPSRQSTIRERHLSAPADIPARAPGQQQARNTRSARPFARDKNSDKESSGFGLELYFKIQGSIQEEVISIEPKACDNQQSTSTTTNSAASRQVSGTKTLKIQHTTENTAAVLISYRRETQEQEFDRIVSSPLMIPSMQQTYWHTTAPAGEATTITSPDRTADSDARWAAVGRR